MVTETMISVTKRFSVMLESSLFVGLDCSTIFIITCSFNLGKCKILEYFEMPKLATLLNFKNNKVIDAHIFQPLNPINTFHNFQQTKIIVRPAWNVNPYMEYFIECCPKINSFQLLKIGTGRRHVFDFKRGRSYYTYFVSLCHPFCLSVCLFLYHKVTILTYFKLSKAIFLNVNAGKASRWLVLWLNVWWLLTAASVRRANSDCINVNFCHILVAKGVQWWWQGTKPECQKEPMLWYEIRESRHFCSIFHASWSCSFYSTCRPHCVE